MKRLTLLFLVGCAMAFAACGDGGDSAAIKPAKAEAASSEPVELPLKQSHHSGVSGTARLVQDGDDLHVTLTLDKRTSETHLAHIHTGPCSQEPTLRNPRVWATLTDVVHSRSETVVQVATLPELQSESSSINVHDPDHHNRPLVCGDIPRAP